MNLPIHIANKWNHTIFILLRLPYFTEHNILRFIHVVAWIRTSFLFKANIQFYVHTAFRVSSVDGQLGCSHLLAIVKDTAVNLGAGQDKDTDVEMDLRTRGGGRVSWGEVRE